MQELTRADRLLAEVREVKAQVQRIANKAEQANDLRTALVALGHLKGILELQAKVAEEEQPEQHLTTNLQVLALPMAPGMDRPPASAEVQHTHQSGGCRRRSSPC